MSIIKFLDNNPLISGYISIGSIAAGQVVSVTESHIPPIIMESVQLLVWIVGIIAGLITIHGWLRKYIFKKKS